MSNEYLLNKIQLKDGRELLGIVDFHTKKQLYFFDFTYEKAIDYLLLAILWKGNNDNLRFSVYCAINFPDIILPNVILIPSSHIKTITGNLPEFNRPKQRKRLIKKSI